MVKGPVILKRGFLLIFLTVMTLLFIFHCAELLITNLAYRPAVILTKNKPVNPFPTCNPQEAGSSKPYSEPDRLFGSRTYFDYFASGWLLAQQNKCEEAYLNLSKATLLEEQGRNSANFLLAQVLYSLGKKDQAIAVFKEIGAARFFYSQAVQAKLAGNNQLALELNKIAVETEILPEYMDGLTLILVDQNQTELAISLWEKLAQTSPESDVNHWLALGEVGKLEQDWGQAVQAYQKGVALSANPDVLYDLYLRIIKILTIQKNWPAIGQNAEKAIALKPAVSADPYTSAGTAELEMDHYEKAIEWYDRAIKVLPYGPWPYILAGNAAVKFGFYNEAERRFTVALKLSPDNYAALLYMGLLKYQQGNVAQAISYLEKIEPNDCNILERLAGWYSEIGNSVRTQQYTAQIKTRCQK